MQSRRALAASKAEFEAQNRQLLEELPHLYDSRVEYFQPSLQAFVSAQVTKSALVSYLYFLCQLSISTAGTSICASCTIAVLSHTKFGLER